MSHNAKVLVALNIFGGKHNWLKDLYAYFPDDQDFDHLIDVFCGSMAVSLNYNRRSPILVKTANDKNDDIVNFFEQLRDNEDRLIELLELTPVAKTEFHNCWEKSSDPAERARRMYVRIRQSFFGLGHSHKGKGWHMTKTYNNAHGGESVSRFKNGTKNLRQVAKVIRENFQITNFDCIDCIKRLDYEKSFFYCDPPYHKDSRGSYGEYGDFEFSDAQHEELADRLHTIKGLAMVSGYRCELMDELYKDWKCITFPSKKNNIRSKPVRESVWINYTPRSVQGSLNF